MPSQIIDPNFQGQTFRTVTVDVATPATDKAHCSVSAAAESQCQVCRLSLFNLYVALFRSPGQSTCVAKRVTSGVRVVVDQALDVGSQRSDR